MKGENAPRAGEELILEGLRRHLEGEKAPRAGEELISEGLRGHPVQARSSFGREFKST